MPGKPAAGGGFREVVAGTTLRGMSDITPGSEAPSGRAGRRERPPEKHGETLAYIADGGHTNYSIERQIAMEGEFFQGLAQRGGTTRALTKLFVLAMLTAPFWIILWALLSGPFR